MMVNNAKTAFYGEFTSAILHTKALLQLYSISGQIGGFATLCFIRLKNNKYSFLFVDRQAIAGIDDV